MKVLLVICVVFCACSARYIPPNPCPDLFAYIQVNGMILGRVNLPNDLSGNYIIAINMSARVLFTDNENIKLELKTPSNEILQGKPLSYYIYFPIQDVIPRLTEIKFNGDTYCSGPPEELTSAGVTHMWSSLMFSAEHQQQPCLTCYPHRRPTINNVTPAPTRTTFPPTRPIYFDTKTPSPPPQSTTTTKAEPPPTRPPPPPSKPPRLSTTVTTSTIQPTPSSSEDEAECGQSFVQYLAVGEGAIEEGQFPWTVAIMHSQGRSTIYRCTGSLISNKHVVSAGHCVFNSNGPWVPFSDVFLVLGKVNIEKWFRGAVTRGVETAIVHPDFKKARADADIAVLFMDQAVRYEDAIKPICLWEGNNDLNRIVGKDGTIAGWGKIENQSNVTQARKATLPVVSQEDCVKSNRGLKRLVSDTTFCGGSRDKTGPCPGDGGAGFAMLIDGKWFLRGVFSLSLENGSPCNLDDYFVFADAAKFVSWLKSVIA